MPAINDSSAAAATACHSISVERQSGNALFIVLIIILMVLGVLTLMMSAVTTASGEIRATKDHLQRLYTAEAGIQQALLEITNGRSGTLGSEQNPVPFGDGGFWVQAEQTATDTYTIVSVCELHGGRRAVEVVVRRTTDPFKRVIYAGNGASDPTYSLVFGGSGTSADEVIGDIYSGGDIDFAGNASLTGTAKSSGTITGVPGTEGVHEPSPYFGEMNYAASSDVYVTLAFDEAQYQSSAAGGQAWQLPAESPAHVFRKNPSDRMNEILGTTKDDYFFEDPYETPREDNLQDGTSPYVASLVAESGAEGARVVFYIDGNLWLHNLNTNSFRIDSVGTKGVQVTFAVHGNIYLSDNVFLDSASLDGVAFVALRDEMVNDSGNIYLGDAVDGSLANIDAFLYAEGRIQQLSLDPAAGGCLCVKGALAAGEGIVLQSPTAGLDHVKMRLEFDDRMSQGNLNLPGLPDTSTTLGFLTVAWREVGALGGGAESDAAATEAPTSGNGKTK
ncbi:MAG: hypothetical protein KDB53_09215 [Planctomycetes bacterium]|nr:hypothetical protein [Planctomycetota bacterium]